MIWCIRHRFLEHICSRYADFGCWSADVIERKEAANERHWPEIAEAEGYNEASHCTLFIEQALQNLGIEQSYRDNEEDGAITCLLNEQSPSMFSSIITTDQFSFNRYPFRNLCEAVDMLFLRGASDMVIAKQAIVSFSFVI
jgi:E3 ubiquitin-protein ligase HOS1